MGNIRKKYTEQFKADAVDLVLRGRPISELSRDLGVHHSQIQRWKKAHLEQMDARHKGVGKTPSELEAENRQLRKELAELREINVILKKTIKYVS